MIFKNMFRYWKNVQTNTLPCQHIFRQDENASNTNRKHVPIKPICSDEKKNVQEMFRREKKSKKCSDYKNVQSGQAVGTYRPPRPGTATSAFFFFVPPPSFLDPTASILSLFAPSSSSFSSPLSSSFPSFSCGL